ncbi:hypothetical protein N9W78_01585 [bacterium]|nr:hypothetical protein [bacterium]
MQGGAIPANLGFSSHAAGFREYIGGKAGGPPVAMERQMVVEVAVAKLSSTGQGVYDSVRKKWLSRPVTCYQLCAEVLRAEYRAHPAYGDARYEPPGKALPKTLKRLGISKRTYYRKLALSQIFVAQSLGGDNKLISITP